MRPPLAGLTLISGMLLTGVPVPAHHSFDATYVMLEKITVEGGTAPKGLAAKAWPRIA
jgi:hypothetical protein